MGELLNARGVVDVVIPRGGASLIERVVRESTVPVIETGVGNCHVYVDASADPAMAEAIVLNSKTHRVSVCNAAETLLVHRDVPFLPRLLAALADAGVTLHGDDPAQAAHDAVVPATDEDWATEYLSMDMAVRVVDDLPGRSSTSRGGGAATARRSSPTPPPPSPTSPPGSMPPRCWSTPRPGSPTAASSASAPRSASPPRSCTPGARSACPELTSTTYVVTGNGHTR